MYTVTFKTEEAIFQFDRKTVMEFLKNKKTSYQINELDTLTDVLSNQLEQSILTLAEHQYFGHITIEIIDASEGTAFCKKCGKRYHTNQLHPFNVGPDNASVEVATGMKRKLKSLFRKKPKPIGLSGGKGYKCPRGHMLIFMITWIS